MKIIKIINDSTLEIDGINYTNFDKAIVIAVKELVIRIDNAIELIEDNSKSLKTREYIDLDKGYVKILNEILRGDNSESN